MFTTVEKPESKQRIPMEGRQCPQCKGPFKVMVGSPQVFCNLACEKASPLKKPRPIKKTAPWASLKRDTAHYGEGKTRIPPGASIAPKIKAQEPEKPSKHTSKRTYKKTRVKAKSVKKKAKSKPSRKARKKPGLDEKKLEARWQRYVAHAKKFVTGMNKGRMEIARLAMSACQISWGGGNHWKKFDGVYTLKAFAEEIGVSSKTLSAWVAIRRDVMNKLPAGVYDESQYMAAYRTKMRIKRNSKKEEVTRVYDEELKRDQVNFYFYQGLKKIKTTRHLVFNKVNLSDLDFEEVVEMRDLCKEIDKRLTKFIRTHKSN